MSINSIVNVQITRETQSVSQAGFGTPLLLGSNKRWNDLIRYYSDMQEVSEDFQSYDPEFQAANAVFSQPLTPVQIAIGRRQADEATIDVITAMSGKSYSVNVNGQVFTLTNSTPSAQQSSVNFSTQDFVTGNLINLSVNSVKVGTITSIIDFDIDFVSLNSIVATVNGVALSANTFTTDQATTISAVATKIGTATGVASSTVTGARQITVVFTSEGNNTVNSVVTTLGASQPTATISEGGFFYNTSQLVTMQSMQTALELLSTVESVQILPDGSNPNRILQITTKPNQSSVLTLATVKLGSSRPTPVITTTTEPVSKESIAEFLSSDIQSGSSYVNSVDHGNGTFTLTSKVSGTPWTLSVSTNIVNANEGLMIVEDSIPNTLYQLTLNGNLIQYTSNTLGQTNDEISIQLVAIINLIPDLGITATNNSDGSFTLTSNDSSETFTVTNVTPNILSYENGLLIETILPSEDVVTSITAIQAVNDDWYGVILLDRTSATVQELAAWIEGQIKIFITASSDPNIINQAISVDTTSIAAILNSLGYTRSAVLYHQNANSSWPDAAWMGRCLPFAPGSETWAFKSLNGVAYSDLTTTQNNNVFNKAANTYTYVAGFGITQKGTMANGEYIDIIRGIDWLTSTIQNYVFFVLANSIKVPYTDAGITNIQAQVQRALAQGVAQNFLTNDPAPIVTVPKAINISSADKAARILRNVNFVATLSGAIQSVQIVGNIQV